MKAKRTIVVLAVVLLTMLFFVSASHANRWYYNSTIISIGVTEDGYMLKADNGGNIVQKYLDPTDDKTLLAVILTAQSLGSTIHVYVDTTLNSITGVMIANP